MAVMYELFPVYFMEGFSLQSNALEILKNNIFQGILAE